MADFSSLPRYEAQGGFLTLFHAFGQKPLRNWLQQSRFGQISRVRDEDLNSSAMEISGSNISTCFIKLPIDERSLGIQMPVLSLIVKNMNQYFSYEVVVKDSAGDTRRFRVSNYQTTPKVKSYVCTMPLRLDEGWNLLHLNLSDYCQKAYSTDFVEVKQIIIHANCRLRHVFMAEKMCTEAELPLEYQVKVDKAKSSESK